MSRKFAVGTDRGGWTATAASVVVSQGHILLYLDISASWQGTPWSRRSQDRDSRRATGTGGPAVYGFLGHAWICRFCQSENRGSTRSIHQPHSALNWGRQKKIALVFRSYMILWLLNNLLLRLTLRGALHEFVTGLEVVWADVVAPPAQQVQALTAPRARLTVHAGLAVCWALCKDNRVEVHLSISGVPKSTFQGSGRVFCPTGQKTLPLRKVPRWNHCLPDRTGKPRQSMAIVGCIWGLQIQLKNHALGLLKLTGSTFPLCFVADEPLGAGLLAFAQVKVESCSAPRAEVLGEAGVALWPALLTKKNRPTAGVYLNHKLSSASRMLNIHRVTVLHVSLGIQLRVQIDVLYTDALDLI